MTYAEATVVKPPLTRLEKARGEAGLGAQLAITRSDPVTTP